MPSSLIRTRRGIACQGTRLTTVWELPKGGGAVVTAFERTGREYSRALDDLLQAHLVDQR